MKELKKRILVVDDTPSDSELLKRYFEECFAYEVLAENDPTSAVLAGERFEPDLIILDLVMPGMDGLQLAAALKANEKLKRVPIIFITAAISREEVTAAGGRIQNTPFLAKPIHLGEAAAVVQACFAKQAALSLPTEVLL